MKLRIRPRLKVGSMASYVRLGLDPRSALKDKARLGIKIYGLIPSLP